MKIILWNERDRPSPAEAACYPDGIHRSLAAHLAARADLSFHTRSLDDPAQGLEPEDLATADVLVVWAHHRHSEVSEASILRVQQRVLAGMGLVVLHSAVWWPPFVRLMGTTCQLNYRMTLEREMLWCVHPGHPIAQGVGTGLTLEQEEVYCEHFDIPHPDELIFLSSFAGGEAFRSGCCWRRGAGHIFYFRPGHETVPTYHDPRILRVIENAIRWACPTGSMRFESGPKEQGFIDRPTRPEEPLVVGRSHLFAPILPPEKYIR